MKRIVSSVLVCVLVIGMMFTLASCTNQLYGTYETEGGTVSFEFAGEEVTLTLNNTSVKGTYTIEDDKITFDFDSLIAALYNGEKSYAKGEENGKDYIKISGITYYKK